MLDRTILVRTGVLPVTLSRVQVEVKNATDGGTAPFSGWIGVRRFPADTDTSNAMVGDTPQLIQLQSAASPLAQPHFKEMRPGIVVPAHSLALFAVVVPISAPNQQRIAGVTISYRAGRHTEELHFLRDITFN